MFYNDLRSLVNEKDGAIEFAKSNNFVQALAEYDSIHNFNHYDSTIYNAEGKKQWAYGYKTYLNRVIDAISDPLSDYKKVINSKLYSNGSKLIKFLNADTKLIDSTGLKTKDNNGVTAKRLNFYDTLTLDINNFYNVFRGPGLTSYFRLPSFETKSRSDLFLNVPKEFINLDSFGFNKEGYIETFNTKNYVNNTLDYFVDELERMVKYNQTNQLINMENNYVNSYLFPQYSMKYNKENKLTKDQIYLFGSDLKATNLKNILNKKDKKAVVEWIKLNTELYKNIEKSLIKSLNKGIRIII